MSVNCNKLSPKITSKSKKEQENKSYIFKFFELNFVITYSECMFYKARKKNEFLRQARAVLNIREMRNFVNVF